MFWCQNIAAHQYCMKLTWNLIVFFSNSYDISSIFCLLVMPFQLNVWHSIQQQAINASNTSSCMFQSTDSMKSWSVAEAKAERTSALERRYGVRNVQQVPSIELMEKIYQHKTADWMETSGLCSAPLQRQGINQVVTVCSANSQRYWSI